MPPEVMSDNDKTFRGSIPLRLLAGRFVDGRSSHATFVSYPLPRVAATRYTPQDRATGATVNVGVQTGPRESHRYAQRRVSRVVAVEEWTITCGHTVDGLASWARCCSCSR